MCIIYTGCIRFSISYWCSAHTSTAAGPIVTGARPADRAYRLIPVNDILRFFSITTHRRVCYNRSVHNSVLRVMTRRFIKRRKPPGQVYISRAPYRHYIKWHTRFGQRAIDSNRNAPGRIRVIDVVPIRRTPSVFITHRIGASAAIRACRNTSRLKKTNFGKIQIDGTTDGVVAE